MSLAARAEVQESHAREPYPVHARPGQTLREALNAATPITSGGQRFHGYTHWNVRWNFWWQQDTAGRCRITRVSTRLQSRIQMPELATGTVAQTAAFARYHAALYQHELGHVGLGVSILIYGGGVQFGVITDTQLCTVPQQIIDAFAPEFAALSTLTLMLPWGEED